MTLWLRYRTTLFVSANDGSHAACASADGVRLGMNLLLTPDNVRNIARSLDVAVDLGLQSVTFLRPKGAWPAAHWPSFPAPADLAALAESLRSYLAREPPLRLYVDTALRGQWTEMGFLDDPEPEVLGCGGAERHVAVTPAGDVYPCSHARWPEFRMGNLLTDEMESLWSAGPGLQARRRYAASCRGVECPCCAAAAK